MEKDVHDIVDPISKSAVLDGTTLTFSQDIDILEQELMSLEHQVNLNAKTAAVILAGGSGSRFGREGGKQLLKLAGCPILTWASAAFDAVGDVGLIVIVCPEERIEEYKRAAVDPYPFVTPIVFAPSGFIRQESSFNGINAIPDTFEYIALHDGARPIVTPALITHAINVLKGSIDLDGVVTGHPSIDTLKVVDANGVIVGTPDRSRLWNAQTPQVFRAQVCRDAFNVAMAQGFVGTDDSSVLEHNGARIMFVESPRDNIKVTVPEDLAPVEAALRARHR